MTNPDQSQSEDQMAIRDLVHRWLDATKAGDYETVLTLMADDVVFLVPGREPFGKEAFRSQSQQLKNALVEGKSDIQEIEVIGDRAWMVNRLEVRITPPNAQPMTRSGYTLTIFRKQADGKWVIARDANLVT
jgi:uncharacterized protein (TIGR02246 family)